MSRKFWLTGVCISLVLALGLGIRLTGLERKYFWLDELNSSFVITGHWPPFVEQELSRYSGQMIRVGVALGVLEQMPNRAPLRLVGALAANDPLHCPLYYLLAQEWSKHFAAGPKNLRLLASLLGVAGLPLFFWLCMELFGTLSSGVLGMALLAVAPFHILYSQQN